MKRALRFGAQAVLPGLVLLCAYLVTSSLLEGPESGEGRAPRGETVYAVTAVDVALGDHRATLRAFGEVVAADTADLRVASPGEVIAVDPGVRIGRTVEAGTPLVTIDPFAYEGAKRDAEAQLAEARGRKAEAEARIKMEEAGLARADEQLELAQTDLDRADRLSRSGTITDKALDDRRLLVSQRRQARDQREFTLAAEIARRDQQIAAIERLTWQVERAERALADTVLIAPFDGIVRSENAAVGRLLSANDLAVALIRADALDVRFVLSDQRFGRLLSEDALYGAEIEVIWRIGDQPISYDATVTRAGADIESGRAGVDVFARLDLTGLPMPRPGAFVEVLVPGVVHAQTARIPVAALNEGSVFVIDGDQRLEERDITVLALDDGDAIVRGGLVAGDQVVTTRLAEAGNGIKVNRVDPFADGEPDTATDLTAGDPASAADLAASEATETTPAAASREPRRRGDGGPRGDRS